jgi:hypothetical protein
MDQSTNKIDPLREVQTPIAFRRLQGAMTEYIEDLNRRFNAGLAVRQTQTTFEVHELEKADALVSVSLTGKNDIQYSQFSKRDHELQSGMIYVRVCQDGPPILMFPDFPHPNVPVSYQDASKRLLDSSF